MAKNYLTKERYEKLLKELNELKTTGRKVIGEKLKQAKELGDLSENAEYHSVKEEQEMLEKRIAELENLLENSIIIGESEKSDVVKVGSKVTLKKNNNETVVYRVVGSNETNPAAGFISNVSPLGSNLLNKKVGDCVVLNLKGNKIEYKILKIE